MSARLLLGVEALGLALCCALAFGVRLFGATAESGAVLHGSDPYFHARAVARAAAVASHDAQDANVSAARWLGDAAAAAWDGFDSAAWYPLGRETGAAAGHAGLHATALALMAAVRAAGVRVAFDDGGSGTPNAPPEALSDALATAVCVMTPPLLAAVAAGAVFWLARGARGGGAALLAAALLALCPAHAQGSMAGDFDSEAAGVPAMLLSMAAYAHALTSGSLAAGATSGLLYAWAASCWAGHVFVANIFAVHCLASLAMRRHSSRLYAAQASFAAVGLTLAYSLPTAAATGAGGFLLPLVSLAASQVAAVAAWAEALLARNPAARVKVRHAAVASALGVAAMVAIRFDIDWGARALAFLDPLGALESRGPLYASVAAFKPMAWFAVFDRLHLLAALLPAGFVSCFRPLSDASLLLALSAGAALYLGGVMHSLTVLLAPLACVLGGLALSDLLDLCCRSLQRGLEGDLGACEAPEASEAPEGDGKSGPTADDLAADAADELVASLERDAAAHEGIADEGEDGGGGECGGGGTKAAALRALRSKARHGLLPADLALVCMLLVYGGWLFYAVHGVWTASEQLADPSIAIRQRAFDGSVKFVDDFRQGYGWIRDELPSNAVLGAWWERGYHLGAMADRATLVDGSTWNATQVAAVGRALVSPERKAWRLLSEMGATHVVLLFGGMQAFAGDDMNALPWMVDIAASVFDDVRPEDYRTAAGTLSASAHDVPAKLKSSLVYKLSYYRFAEAMRAAIRRGGGGAGSGAVFDRTRRVDVGGDKVTLRYFEEAHTSRHFLVRVYRLKTQREVANRYADVGRVTKRKDVH